MMLNDFGIAKRGEGKMKTKMLVAVLAVLAMVGASCAVLATDVDTSDGVSSKEISIGKNDTVGQSVMLWFSESQYNVAGVTKYEVTWNASASIAGFTDGFGSEVPLGTRTTTISEDAESVGALSGAGEKTLVGTTSNNLLSVTLSDVPDSTAPSANKYLLNVKNYIGSDQTNSENKVYLKVTATVKLYMGESSTVDIDAYEYQVTVNITDDTLTVSLPEGKTITEKTDTNVQLNIAIPGISNPVRSNYLFYATGLHSGLSMSSDGRIVGYALESGEKTVSVKVVDTTNGKTYYASLDVNVLQATTSDVDVIFKVGDDESANGKSFNFEDGETISFTVIPKNASISVVVAVDSSNGGYKVLTSTGGNATSGYTYSIDTSGDTDDSGSFRVYAYVMDDAGNKDNAYIQVNVYSAADGSVSAEIISTSTP